MVGGDSLNHLYVFTKGEIMEEKVNIELTPLMANVLQRMLVEEIENQEKWIVEEEQEFGTTDHKTRESIIEQCDQVRNQLEEKGFKRYYKCY